MDVGHTPADGDAGQDRLFDGNQRTGGTAFGHPGQREEARAGPSRRQRRRVPETQVGRTLMIDPGHRGRCVQPGRGERCDQPSFVEQARIAVVVHRAGGLASANRQTARHPGGGAHLQAPLGGQDGGRTGRLQITADDQRPGPSRADGVDGRRSAAESLVDLEFGIQSQAREKHRGVAGFQQRKVPAHQHHPLDRAASRQRCTTRLDGHRDGVLVVAGHPLQG